MRPITFAHRGGATPDHPENTVAAFRAARARGAAGVESDVRLSQDGQPVLAHSPVVRRGLRRVPVARLRADDLRGAGIPTLVDLYEAVGLDAEVSLDLKAPDAAWPVVEVARSLGQGALEHLWLCSPDLEVLRALRAGEPRVRLVHSVRRRDVTGSMERHAATLAEERIDAFNMHRTDWSLGLVTLFHRFEVLAFAWGAQDVRHLRDLLAMDIDALYSDHVDRMVATVAELRP